MSNIPFWNERDADCTAWDLVILGGIKLPGICVCDVTHSVEIEEGKTQGNSGTPTVVKGRKSRVVKISVTMWLPEQFNAWFDASKKLGIYGKTTSFEPFSITHPSTSLYGVESVLITNCHVTGNPSSTDGMVADIDCIEYCKALPIKQSATVKKPAAATATDPKKIVNSWASDALAPNKS